MDTSKHVIHIETYEVSFGTFKVMNSSTLGETEGYGHVEFT